MSDRAPAPAGDFRLQMVIMQNDQNRKWPPKTRRGANGLWDGDDGSGLGTL